MVFYLSIILFIASVIGGLVLVIIHKRMVREKFLFLGSLHLMLFLAWMASLLLKKDQEGTPYNYFLLVFLCSGILFSGLAWRSEVPNLIKYYFSIYIITIPMFIFSPSMLVNFLLTGRYTDSLGKRFELGQRYFLETQGTVMSDDTLPHYKVIRVKGMFHETLQRDVVFGGKVDSVKVLQLEPGEMVEIRGYISKKSFVETQIDSSDLTLPLKKTKRNAIEYKL